VETRSNHRVRFKSFELDLSSKELRRNGLKLRLQGQPVEVLTMLLKRAGEVVTREEIQRRLWPEDTFVDFEHSLNSTVRRLRDALGDSADHPRFIETLPRLGYRFIAPIEAANGFVGLASPPNGDPGSVATQTEAAESRLTGAVELATDGKQSAAAVISPPPDREINLQSSKTRWPLAVKIGVLVGLLAITFLIVISFIGRRARISSRLAWEQITDFADSATQPTLSPDGRMIAFIRGPGTFSSWGQIYVKMLPDGQPVQLTNDNELKLAPAFSPDGSRLAYTTVESLSWDTWVVPVLGGEERKLLPNAAALTWIDTAHVVFSEMKTGSLMGVVTAEESRAAERDVYVPADMTNGMAHRSWVSPDHKQVLVSEMNSLVWLPCRVVPFDGSSRGETVGPKAAHCTYAGWSQDGKMMYFSADAGDGYHVWRQQFPDGVPEQLTFGPTEEEGIAISPDGRSLVTSAGIKTSTVWVHDSRGDRQISGEGYASLFGLGVSNYPWVHSAFSPDGKRLFYLVSKRSSEWTVSKELWIADLDSGHTEAVLPGVLMNEFDVSSDGKRVVFEAQDGQGEWHAWVAPLDRHAPPKEILGSGARRPRFGSAGEIYVSVPERSQEIMYRIGPDGTVRMIGPRAGDFIGFSPHGDWLLQDVDPVMAKPVAGGPLKPICSCAVAWGPGGKFLYLRFHDFGETSSRGRIIAIRLPADHELPRLPPGGLRSAEDTNGMEVVADIDMNGKGDFTPGPSPSIYAYVRLSVQRNLFRISMR
jgi:DNA-binding winged helix-turn-helix (wHTH) protein/Tol biopolymer transport system component